MARARCLISWDMRSRGGRIGCLMHGDDFKAKSTGNKEFDTLIAGKIVDDTDAYERENPGWHLDWSKYFHYQRERVAFWFDQHALLIPE